MRTKTLICAAGLLAAGALSSMAQSNVYSLNIVGYANVPFRPGNGYYANPLNLDNTNNANSVLNVATTPGGAGLDSFTLATFNGAAFNYYGYDTSFGGWFDPNTFNPKAPPNIPPGRGFLMQTTLGQFTNTFVGNVLPGPGQTNTLPLAAGSTLAASMLPLSGYVTNAAFAFPNPSQNANNDAFHVLQFNGAAYNDQYFDTSFGGWVNPNTFNPIAPPNVAIGEAYIFQTTLGPINWNQSLPSQ